MSINRNRNLLKKAIDNKSYRVLFLKEHYPPYWDEGWIYWSTSSKGTARHWKKRRLLKYQVRMYRTWKHNRMTKWK